VINRGRAEFAPRTRMKARGTTLASSRVAKTRMKLGAKETIGSLLCLVVIMAVLASINPQVRMKAGAILDDPMGGAVTPWGDKITDLGGAVIDALKDQSIDNGPFLLFAVVSGVLFLFMLKT
jgi:hypothetical protein